MSSAVRSMVLGIVLAGAWPAIARAAEAEAVKPLPTLLIKGEVVSVDASDPQATLIKVKDRYGFETPIYLKPETKISQADAASTASALTSGNTVEVEYNFDVNTAKRHAVSVKIATPKAETPAAAPAPVAPAAAEPAVTAPAATSGAATGATPAAQSGLQTAPAAPTQAPPATPAPAPQ